jgi:hypothetical protein
MLDTNTHSKHVTIIAFPLQQWLHERASVLRYTYIAGLVNFEKGLRWLALAETCYTIIEANEEGCRSQWRRCLWRGSAAAGLLSLWVRIPPGASLFVCWVSCVIRWGYPRRADHSSRGVLPTVVCLECDLESSRMRRPSPALCVSSTENKEHKERC